jgi:hypothetical protein
MTEQARHPDPALLIKLAQSIGAAVCMSDNAHRGCQ